MFGIYAPQPLARHRVVAELKQCPAPAVRLLRVQLEQQPLARIAIAKRAKNRLETARLKLHVLFAGWQHGATREGGLLPALRVESGGELRATVPSTNVRTCASAT